jgi:hypothetical protein
VSGLALFRWHAGVKIRAAKFTKESEEYKTFLKDDYNRL